jgi:hypothetical protein
MGISLLLTGDIAEGRVYLDKAIRFTILRSIAV